MSTFDYLIAMIWIILIFFLDFQVADVQREFSSCSHELSLKLYEEIQTLQEKRYARDTNDLESELEIEDNESEPTLDPIKDIKPKLCGTLHKIANDCIEAFKKCFSREDSNQIQRQHVDQMANYYSNIYEGVGNLTTDCPEIKLLKKGLLDEYNEIMSDDEEEYSEDDYYDDEDYSMNSDNVKGTTVGPDDVNSELNPKFSGRSAESSGYPDDDHQTPVPESGPVIAEPPISLEAGSGAASFITNSQTVQNHLFVLCFAIFLQAWLIR